MGAPQYTKCVDRADYEDPGFGPEIFVAIAGLVYAISTFGISLILSLTAAMSALMKVCEYILYGKLVCLGDDQCAVGRVAAFETVDDKSGVDKIDNDFSINLLLAPHGLAGFASGGTPKSNYDLLKNDTSSWGFDNLPGRLIAEQPSMPTPRESKDAPPTWRWTCSDDTEGASGLSQADAQAAAAKHKTDHPSHHPKAEQDEAHTATYNPTFRTYPYSNYISFDDPPGPWGGHPFVVPIFHCEIEGERAHAVCGTLATLTSPIPGFGKFCGWKPFGIPIGRWVCSFVAALLAPIILTALAIAWAAGEDDNRSFDGAGSLAHGDPIIVRGRWCYDASHSGWNELHPVTSVQKIDNPSALDGPFFKDAVAKWCRLTAEVPPQGAPGGPPTTGPAEPGSKPQGMTPEQETVWLGQQQPENQWVFHPFVDGCEPAIVPPDGAPTVPPIH